MTTGAEAKGGGKRAENASKRLPEVIEQIGKIFTLAKKGDSQGKIARTLMQEGIPSPSATRRKPEAKGRSAAWNKRTIAGILKRDSYYTGLWQYGKRRNKEPEPDRIRKKTDRHRLKGSWAWTPRSEWSKPVPLDGGPAIPKALWDAAHEAMKRTRKTEVGRPTERPTAMLKTLVKCFLCEKAFCIKHRTTAAGPRRWYYCVNRDRVGGMKNGCPARAVPAEALDTAVWNGLKEAVTKLLPFLIKKYRDAMVADVDPTDIARLEATEAKLLKQLRYAIDMEFDEVGNPDSQRVYSDRKTKCQAELKLLRRRLDTLRSENSAVPMVDVASIQRDARDAFDTDDPGEMRQVALAWIDSVTYRPDQERRNKSADPYGDADITFRVPLAAHASRAKGELHEHAVPHYLLLTHNVRVAA